MKELEEGCCCNPSKCAFTTAAGRCQPREDFENRYGEGLDPDNPRRREIAIGRFKHQQDINEMLALQNEIAREERKKRRLNRDLGERTLTR